MNPILATIESDFTDALTASQTSVEAVLGVVALVVIAFVTFKIIKRAVNKA